MKNRIYSKYYKKILLMMFVVSLVPMAFFAYYAFEFVHWQIRAAYIFYSSSLENETKEFNISFQHVDMALLRLSLRNSSRDTVNRERTAANFQISRDMQEELQLISNSDEYLEELYLVSASNGWVLGSTVFLPLNRHPEQEKIEELLAIEQSSFWSSEEDGLYMCRRVPGNAASGKGMLIAKFDINYMMQDITGENEETDTIILDQNGQVMAGDRELVRIWEENRAEDAGSKTDQEVKISKLTYKERPYTVFQDISDYNGWQYLLLVQSSTLEGNWNHTAFMLALVVFALLMADVLAILIASKRLYDPIDEMIRHMVVKNMEMSQKLQMKKQDEQQLFLRQIYQGEVTEADQMLFEKNGLSVKAEEGVVYYVLVIKYYHYFEDPKDRQLYMFVLDNVVNELVDEKTKVFLPTVIGALMYMTCRVKTNSDESAVMKIQMMAMMIVTTVQKYIGYHLNVGISQGFDNLAAIARRTEEARKALQEAMSAKGEVNFFHNRFAAGEITKGYATNRNRMRLLHYVDLGEADACRQELKRYIEELHGLHYYLFRLEISKLASELMNIYEEYGLMPDYDKIGDIIDFDVTNPLNNYDRLESHLWKDWLEPLFSVICSQTEERDMMQQIVEYIMDNLESNMSLEECARHFNYNANYLSRWFKKKMGVTYTDFVTSKKMELCKRLLADSDISINELADRFGYSSPQNFIRVFKKYTMQTPGQYRKTAERRKST